MKRYNIISFVFLSGFLLIFQLMANGVSLGAFEKIALGSMVVFPLAGVVTGLKGEGWGKWVLVTLNAVVLAIILYAFLLVQA